MTFPYKKRLCPTRMSANDRLVLADLRKLFKLHGSSPMKLNSRYLSTLTGISQAHCGMHLKRLLHLGMLEVVVPGRQGSRTPGTYLLTEKGRDAVL